jgi:hypothetical protein
LNRENEDLYTLDPLHCASWSPDGHYIVIFLSATLVDAHRTDLRFSNYTKQVLQDPLIIIEAASKKEVIKIKDHCPTLYPFLTANHTELPHSSVQWSPDGKWLAALYSLHVRNANILKDINLIFIWSIDNNNYTLEKVKDLPCEGPNYFSWSPNSTYLLIEHAYYVAKEQKVFIINIHEQKGYAVIKIPRSNVNDDDDGFFGRLLWHSKEPSTLIIPRPEGVSFCDVKTSLSDDHELIVSEQFYPLYQDNKDFPEKILGIDSSGVFLISNMVLKRTYAGIGRLGVRLRKEYEDSKIILWHVASGKKIKEFTLSSIFIPENVKPYTGRGSIILLPDGKTLSYTYASPENNKFVISLFKLESPEVDGSLMTLLELMLNPALQGNKKLKT